MSFLSLLAITFIVLKLCGVIGWAWAWVLAPLWIGAAVALVALVVVAVLHLIAFRKKP